MVISPGVWIAVERYPAPAATRRNSGCTPSSKIVTLDANYILGQTPVLPD